MNKKPKILFLDDAKERVKLFKQNYIGYDYTIAMSYVEAIKALKENYYDVVFLDHDLVPESYAGVESPDIKTGLDVAKFILTLDKLPHEVIVHSLNPVGAKNIALTLKPKILNVYIQPFAWTKNVL